MGSFWMSIMLVRVSVCGNVMRDVFVDWSNMLSGFVPRAIAGRRTQRIVRGHPFVVSGSVCFVGLTTSAGEKSFLAPERHRHQARHVERSARGRDRADQPYEPAERDVRSRSCLPENLVFGPETAERNDAAD